MNIGLIDPNDQTSLGRGIYDLPVGLLSISAVADRLGHQVSLFSPNNNKTANTSLSDAHILRSFVDELATSSLDLLGLSVRSDTLPLAIEIAKQFTGKQKNVPIVFGGAGANFIDRELMEQFPFVDMIVRGEGEESFAELLSGLENAQPLSEIAGLTLRGANGDIIRTPNRSLIHNLDDLPDLSFHLLETILKKTEIISAHVAVGRGCPNNCTFCSSRQFWGPKVRMRSPKRVVEEMNRLHELYEISHFILIHDNLFSDKTFVHQFCNSLRKTLPNVTFELSASLNYTTPEIVKTVAKSGCTSVFLGIETGSTEIAKKSIPKKQYTSAAIHNALNIYRKNKVRVTKSHIIGFPEEPDEDMNQTLKLAIDAQASSNCIMPESIQIHPLVLNPGTKLYKDYANRLVQRGAVGDFADPRIIQVDSLRKMCEQHPYIFTSYASHLNQEKHSQIIELCNFFAYIGEVMPKTMSVSFNELSLPPVEFLQRFKKQAFENGFSLPDLGTCIASDRSDLLFPFFEHFSDVLVEMYQHAGTSDRFIKRFLAFENPRTTVIMRKYRNCSLLPEEELESKLPEFIPFIPRTSVSFSLSYDPDKLFLNYWQSGSGSLDKANKPAHYIYFMPRQYAAVTQVWGFDVWKLSRLESALVPHMLKLVDGERSALEVVQTIARYFRFQNTPKILEKNILKYLSKMLKSGVLMVKGELSD